MLTLDCEIRTLGGCNQNRLVIGSQRATHGVASGKSSPAVPTSSVHELLSYRRSMGLNRPVAMNQAKGVTSDTLVTHPHARRVRGAVGWLLGPELLGQLRKMLRERSDPRDWMP
mgnify:CR=1 FL=1